MGRFIADLELWQAFFPASLRSEYAARAAAALGSTTMKRADRLERSFQGSPHDLSKIAR
jgi:hypothetical protein